MISLAFPQRRFIVRHPGFCNIFDTILVMSEVASVSDSLITAVVNELSRGIHPYCVALHERHRAEKETRWFRIVSSSRYRRWYSKYSKYWVLACQGGQFWVCDLLVWLSVLTVIVFVLFLFHAKWQYHPPARTLEPTGVKSMKWDRQNKRKFKQIILRASLTFRGSFGWYIFFLY